MGTGKRGGEGALAVGDGWRVVAWTQQGRGGEQTRSTLPLPPNPSLWHGE